jgi:phosphatidate cytidylyltransferase
MKIRVLTAIVMVAVMVPFFVFSDTVMFPILMALLASIGICEMQGCIGNKKQLFGAAISVLCGAGMPFLARYYNGENLFGFIFLISFSVIALTFVTAVFSGNDFSVEIAALSSSTSVYIAFGFTSLVLLRDLKYGVYIFIIPFVISWMTDTFAYFSGMLFGKHKLIPSVSPKKTVEGAVGGTVCAVLLTLLYGFIAGKISNSEPQYLSIGIIATIVSVLSQCGDLVMSLIKRKFQIKDYGKIFPGHGGVLDRFDSIIISSSFIYFLTTLVPFMELFK